MKLEQSIEAILAAQDEQQASLQKKMAKLFVKKRPKKSLAEIELPPSQEILK